MNKKLTSAEKKKKLMAIKDAASATKKARDNKALKMAKKLKAIAEGGLL